MALFAKKVSMPTREQALPGRAQRMPVAAKHFVLGNPMTPPFPEGLELALFGLCDEPMMDLHDTTMKYVLHIERPDRHVWEVFAMAGGGGKVFDFIYEKRNEE